MFSFFVAVGVVLNRKGFSTSGEDRETGDEKPREKGFDPFLRNCHFGKISTPNEWKIDPHPTPPPEALLVDPSTLGGRRRV